MGRLEIRLLGGFEVWHDGQLINGFESQKVRALLAYLVLNHDTAHTRDHLAGLLWSEKDDETARRNLRQAVYNLRTSLPHADTPSPPILTTHQSVQFNPETDYWLDVAAFEDAVRRGMSVSAGVDPRHLAVASDLYRGDFLAGFFIADSPAFEHWVLYEQERLREMAIQTLRRLVDYYLASREYRLGIQYAQRLLEIDPLFEEAHRNLMRLYALSGRRSRALSQYETCRNLLRDELGVEPLEETTALYQAVLAEEWPATPSAGKATPASPPVPLVGRDAAYARLRRSWEATCQGMGRLTLVEGEAGIGKTRLIEDFIRQAVTDTQTMVLCGRCYELAPRVAYQPIAEALREIIGRQRPLVRQALASLTPGHLAEMVRLVPELYALHPDLSGPSRLSESGTHQRLFEAVARFLEALARLTRQNQRNRSVILFLDDLHRADRAGLELLQYLVRRLNGAPIWIVATYTPEELDPEHPLLPLRRQLSRDQRVDRVALDRLSLTDIERIAAAIVGDERAGELAKFLDRESGGLPLTIVELVNWLCDQGILVARRNNRWSLNGPLPALATPTPENPRNLIIGRVSQLPTSARRLLTLAAVIGPQFGAGLLREAAGEHMAVVDASADIWLERRLVRPALRQWTEETSKAVGDAHLSAAWWRTFEFVHDRIRLVVYYDVNPKRRRVMHREVAEVLEKHYAGDLDRVCEALAYHYTAAEVWDKAFTYLLRAGDKAREALANDTALYYYDQALAALDHMEDENASEAERQHCLEKRFQVLVSRAEVYSTPDAQDKREADLQCMRDIVAQLNGPDHLSAIVAQLDALEPFSSNGRGCS